MIESGSFVRIHKIVLQASERMENIPSDTASTNLQMWTKGILLKSSNIGDEVEIKTLSGRIETGTLVDVNHSYEVNYGEFVEEIIPIGIYLKEKLHG